MLQDSAAELGVGRVQAGDRGESDPIDAMRLRSACRDGEWSFTCRPLLHVHHTWVVERSALLGCEWTIFSSRRFASPRDDDVTWTISLEVDNSLSSSGRTAGPTLRAPESVRVCVAFGTSVPHKRIFFRAILRAQQEALATAAPGCAVVEDVIGDLNLGNLSSMTRADPNQQQHIGDLYIVTSERALTLRVDIAYLTDTQTQESDRNTLFESIKQDGMKVHLRGPKEASARPPSVSLRVPPCSLAADMDDLLKTGRLADAVLVAADDGYECRVHKAILGARSPVFAAMFEHDMAESKSNRVVVGDVSGDVLLQVLRYIYTGRVDQVRSLGVEMLALADRYALHRLKALCEEELAASVDLDNALDVLATADLYDAREVRDAALQCVCSNIHRVLASDAWSRLVDASPHLLHQVLARCVNYPEASLAGARRPSSSASAADLKCARSMATGHPV